MNRMLPLLLASALLVACQGSPEPTPAAPIESSVSSPAATSAPTATPSPAPSPSDLVVPSDRVSESNAPSSSDKPTGESGESRLIVLAQPSAETRFDLTSDNDTVIGTVSFDAHGVAVAAPFAGSADRISTDQPGVCPFSADAGQLYAIDLTFVADADEHSLAIDIDVQSPDYETGVIKQVQTCAAKLTDLSVTAAPAGVEVGGLVPSIQAIALVPTGADDNYVLRPDDVLYPAMSAIAPPPVPSAP